MTDSVRIQAGALTKRYGHHAAVKSLDLSVEAGSILGLVGPNGAGKTTTLRCLAGIIPPTSGRIVIDGFDLAEQPLEAKRRLSFVPDTPHLFDYLTVEEHLRFAGRIYGIPDVAERIDALLSEFELDDRRNHLPGTLSRGMKQKVAICLGFLHAPTAIFLDEPLTGLDPLGIRRMKSAISRRAQQDGAAVIVSSHQLELIEEICDGILVIQMGSEVISGSLESIRDQLEGLPDDPTLEDIFFAVTGGEDDPRTAAP